MPILRDYVASLVTSVTEARVMSDIKTVELAKIYLANEYLRNFAIPRMRIGDVNMNVPVAIDFTEGKTAINYNLDVKVATETVFSTVCFGYGLKVTEVDAVPDTAKALRAKISGSIEALKADVEAKHNLDNLRSCSEEIATQSKEILKQAKFNVDKIPPSSVSPSIETTLRNEFLLTSIDKIDVLVEASQLKEQATQTILNLNINIVEDGMVWAISDVDKKLIPE
ncbi:MAG: hypothetical protein LBB53_01990 [Prevotellaceae bacterium]|jgi:hypothetical protein|nr:hypothetical protein [Prevotellaceae bacterium]